MQNQVASSNDLLTVALANYMKKLDADVPVGVHPIDETITLHVSGSVTRQKDTMRTPTTEIPLLATMAFFLERAGATRDASKAMLIEAMTEALNADTESVPSVQSRVKDIESAMKHVRDITSKLPKKKVKGATLVNVQVEVVATDPFVAARNIEM